MLKIIQFLSNAMLCYRELLFDVIRNIHLITDTSMHDLQIIEKLLKNSSFTSARQLQRQDV